ncbi:hypothetical protein Tco_0690518 [Tanacetum coccineum]
MSRYSLSGTLSHPPQWAAHHDAVSSTTTEICFIRSLARDSLTPSRKDCRSHTTSVTILTPCFEVDSQILLPDLLPPRQEMRFSDGVVLILRDGVEEVSDLEDTIYDIVHYMSEVRIDRITEIETTQRQLETSQLVASGERASLVERIRSLRLEYLKVRAMLSIERDRIDSIRWHMALSQEEFRQVRRDRDDTRRRLRRLESYVERHLGFRP